VHISTQVKTCQTQRLFFEWHFAHFDGNGIDVVNFANFKNILPNFPPKNLYVIKHYTIDDRCQDHGSSSTLCGTLKIWNLRNGSFRIPSMVASLSMNQNGTCKAEVWGRLCWNVCTLVLLLTRNNLHAICNTLLI
jgi:hypothetical protein